MSLRPDPTDPADMSPEERMDEVANILARGILRLHGRVPGHPAPSRICRNPRQHGLTSRDQYHLRMPTPTPLSALWKNIARELEELDAHTLRGLLHDLYKLAPENRAFLAAWIGDEDAPSELLGSYKARITAQFFTRGAPRLKGGCDLALCRRLIKEYRRVTAGPQMLGGFDVHGFIDLAMHYIEVGMTYANALGWDEARPYVSMAGVAAEITALCRDRRGSRCARAFLPRARAAAQAARAIGYGFGDDMNDLVAALDELAASHSARAAQRGLTPRLPSSPAPVPSKD